jgi:ATP-dependent 26S proteasome regulatory subunit
MRTDIISLAPPKTYAISWILHTHCQGIDKLYLNIPSNNDSVRVFFTGEQPLQVARCTKIINADSDDPKYIINVKQFAKFVVDLGDQVAPTDIEEGMRVG